ncbi:MAG: gliding motility-associated C-terminal domain-containing protein [Prevotella sp.]|nr:gliding motility-associated C-terminal domain-containing protein [Prevotella sp.]
MMTKKILTTILAIAMPLMIMAQEEPRINPMAEFSPTTGSPETGTVYNGQAPLRALFKANVSDQGGFSSYFEWRFRMEGETEPYLIRYEEDTEVTFTKAGSHLIELYAIFTLGNDTVSYLEDYWKTNEPLKVTISESMLEMPNAFSPNGDDKNEIYKAKKYESLVEFHATIFNRWGQKLYEWTDPAGGWDGKYNGRDVKQGVYFVLVKAKGADGRKYNIRKDVNLLRGYTETTRGYE